ncbi:MAG: hypothetical protein KJ793_01305 [Candidatus Omnitrophica bacterium]|nr:hypothetical protein [Candidatus Omnitrophota bacterium]
MEKKRIEIIVTSVLVLVFILVWVRMIKVMNKRKAPKPRPSSSLIIVPPTSSVQPDASGIQEAIPKEVFAWGKCPFSGKAYSTLDKGSGIALSGIIWDEEIPMAVINDRILLVGDSLGSNTVISIEKEKVILSDGSKNIELRLP